MLNSRWKMKTKNLPNTNMKQKKTLVEAELKEQFHIPVKY